MAGLAQVLQQFESLPEEVKEKLAELDLELSEGGLYLHRYDQVSSWEYSCVEKEKIKILFITSLTSTTQT